MRTGDPRRVFLWAILAAIAIGFAFGWFGRIWYKPSPEERAREKAEEIRTKVREFTR